MDAALLGSIAGMWPFSTSLPKLVENVDFDMREVPTFDEASYGLARLIARDLISATYSPTKGIRLRATQAGRNLRRAAGRYRRETSKSRWARIGEISIAIAHLEGAPSWPTPEVEDRSVGRLPKLAKDTWDEYVAAYGRDWEQDLARLARGERTLVERVTDGVFKGLTPLIGLLRRDRGG